MNEEANARITVANDVAKLAESLKDLKAALADECSKIQAKVANSHGPETSQTKSTRNICCT